MGGVFVKGQGWAPPGWLLGGALFVLGLGPGVGVSVDGAVSLICAGWLPQDGASKGALPRV